MDKEILTSCETILKDLLNLVQTLKKKELHKDEVIHKNGVDTICGTKKLSPKCLYNEMGWSTEVLYDLDKHMRCVARVYDEEVDKYRIEYANGQCYWINTVFVLSRYRTICHCKSVEEVNEELYKPLAGYLYDSKDYGQIYIDSVNTIWGNDLVTFYTVEDNGTCDKVIVDYQQLCEKLKDKQPIAYMKHYEDAARYFVMRKDLKENQVRRNYAGTPYVIMEKGAIPYTYRIYNNRGNYQIVNDYEIAFDKVLKECKDFDEASLYYENLLR